jgi:chromosome partitioning protein
MIVIIGCNKGGAGKSTTATNIAVGLAMRGDDVCLMDADPQRSAARWHKDREEADIEPKLTLVEKLENLSSTLQSLRGKFDHIIVDVAGRNSRELITGGAVADLIIAPHQASQLDLDTLEELETQTIRLKDINPNLEVYIYHAMASTNPTVKETERAEFLEYVSDLEGFKPLSSIGYFRKVYRDVISEGKSVLEVNNDSAAIEIESLLNEVFGNGN